MAQIQIERKYPQSSSSCFEALKIGLPKAGFEIWKMREIAYLLMANREENGKTVSATAMISGSKPASLKLSLSGDEAPEEKLTQMGENILSMVEENLPG